MKTVLGCMEIGRRFPRTQTTDLLTDFLQHHKELDTAYMYSNGASENILGENKKLIQDQDATLATKVHPTDDGFDPHIFMERFNTSLERLQVDSVDLLYLHWNCKKHPLLPILEIVDKVFRVGKINRFGLSNFTAWETTKVYNVCEKNGYIKPTVYQGLYNCLSRAVEPELFPCLRDFNMSFYAYGPLAAGLLAGRYEFEDLKKFDDNTTCRFHNTGGPWAKHYQNMYWHETHFDALNIIKRELMEGRSMQQTAFDWLINHSKLDQSYGDGIIVGFSSMNQYQQNIAAIENSKPLYDKCVTALEEAYSKINGRCPPYYRYNS